MSMRSSPSRSRLSSIERRMPSRLRSYCRREVGGNREALVVHRALGVAARDEEPPDLGGEHVLVSGAACEGGAEAALGQAESVVRRGVEVADAGVPGRLDRGVRLVVGRLAEQVAELRGAESEFGQGQAGPQRATQHRVPPGETA